ALVGQIIEWAGTSGLRWADLVRTYNGFRPHKQLADNVLNALRAVDRTELDEEGRGVLTDALRKILSHHREFPDADWAMKEADLRQLDELYNKFQPHDFVEQHKWLFVSWPNLTRDRSLDYNKHMARVQEERYLAVKEIYESQKLAGLFSLAEKVER